jgi:hypothetical protein
MLVQAVFPCPLFVVSISPIAKNNSAMDGAPVMSQEVVHSI